MAGITNKLLLFLHLIYFCLNLEFCIELICYAPARAPTPNVCSAQLMLYCTRKIIFMQKASSAA